MSYKQTNWRDHPATHAQEYYLRSRGHRVPATKGAASDLIGQLVADDAELHNEVQPFCNLNEAGDVIDFDVAIGADEERDPSPGDEPSRWEDERLWFEPWGFKWA